MNPLHWSLDYGHEFGADNFRGQFLRSLSTPLAAPTLPVDAGRIVHRYTILPNFWAGYIRRKPEESLEIGDLVVERELSEGIWSYRVEHRNHLSGEDLTLEFHCADDETRTLQSPWKILAVNEADGSYSGIEWTGRIVRQDARREIILETKRGLTLSGATLPDDASATCYWALLDLIPAIGRDTLTGIALIEDLQMLHEECRVRNFDTWDVAIDGQDHHLSGYMVFGSSLPPTYWWVAETGDVAAFSTTLATYVLSGREA